MVQNFNVQVLPRPALQHQQEHCGGADAPTHREGEEGDVRGVTSEHRL